MRHCCKAGMGSLIASIGTYLLFFRVPYQIDKADHL